MSIKKKKKQENQVPRNQHSDKINTHLSPQVRMRALFYMLLGETLIFPSLWHKDLKKAGTFDSKMYYLQQKAFYSWPGYPPYYLIQTSIVKLMYCPGNSE